MPLLIFDCDGVLVDSELLEHGVDAELLEGYGLATTVTALMGRFVGVARRDMYDVLFAELGRPLPAGLLEERERIVWQRCQSDLRVIPGIDEALAALAAWPKCVASSSLPEKLRMKLVNTGLVRHFEPHLFSTALVARGKPAPDIYLHAAASVGYRPESCVVIEDAPAGITGARQAGMKVVGFVGGSHATAALAPALIAAGANAIAASAADLPRAVQSVVRSKVGTL
ncbi:MAG TPA: HAD-IA family hydrolase [Reyranella sp.]|nr:HAD-IA family hydrolase [Reyranella sp.]